MSRWSDDENACVWCGARLDSLKYGPGARICWDCATGQTPVIPPPKPRRCFCGMELSRFSMGVVCDSCEQKGVQATTYMADLDWAQPEVN
jgi:hypothetical protein